MARTLPEWIAETDDQRAPSRVRLRIFDRHGGKCNICRQPIIGKRWALDHEKALVNGGENREANLVPVHIACHAVKTAEDVAEKAKIAAKRKAHIRVVDTGPKIQGQPFAKTSKSARREKRAASVKALPPKPMFKQIGDPHA